MSKENRSLILGVRLSPRERKALSILAESEGISDSTAMRQYFRRAIVNAAPSGIFPEKLLKGLNVQTRKTA